MKHIVYWTNDRYSVYLDVNKHKDVSGFYTHHQGTKNKLFIEIERSIVKILNAIDRFTKNRNI